MADNNTFTLNKVSTSGITLFDDNGIMLKLNYLGETLSLIIGEPTEGSDGKKMYPDEKRYPFLITPERAAALYNEIIVKDLLSNENFHSENFSKGVFLNKGKTAVLQIRVQDGEIYLVYCKNINADRIAEESHVFHFIKTEIIEDYDGTTGNFSAQSPREATFYLFCKYLDIGVNELNNAVAHSVRKVNNASTNKIFGYLKGITAKLGVTPDEAYGPTRPINSSYPSSGFMNPGEDPLPFNDEENTNTSMEDIIS